MVVVVRNGGTGGGTVADRRDVPVNIPATIEARPQSGVAMNTEVIRLEHVSVVRDGMPLLDDITWSVGTG